MRYNTSMADESPDTLPAILQPAVFRKAVQQARLQKKVLAYAYTDLLVRCRNADDRKTELGCLNAIRDTFLTASNAKTNKTRMDSINELIQQHPLTQKGQTDGPPSTH